MAWHGEEASVKSSAYESRMWRRHLVVEKRNGGWQRRK